MWGGGLPPVIAKSDRAIQPFPKNIRKCCRGIHRNTAHIFASDPQIGDQDASTVGLGQSIIQTHFKGLPRGRMKTKLQH
jgi:hypothetical protein